MSLPPLYKYLDVQGGKLTLQHRTLKHAKPSTFNDTEDLTIRSIFPEDDETALRQLENGFTDVVTSRLNEPPTCLNLDLRRKIALLQKIFKAKPEMADIIKRAKAERGTPEVFNLEQMRKRNRDFVAEINRYMQGWRILCVSTLKDSERMWERYAEDHQGVVLRIAPNIGKDSKYQLFGLARELS